MGKEFSPTSISCFAATLDAWRERSFTKEYPNVVVDARYESCRVDGKIIDIAEHAWETLGVYHAAPPAHLEGIKRSWKKEGWILSCINE
jgi:hypothetical protein